MLNKILTQTHGLSLLQVPEAVQVSIIKYIHKHMGSVHSRFMRLYRLVYVK